jgi:hypothetical protein
MTQQRCPNKRTTEIANQKRIVDSIARNELDLREARTGKASIIEPSDAQRGRGRDDV